MRLIIEANAAPECLRADLILEHVERPATFLIHELIVGTVRLRFVEIHVNDRSIRERLLELQHAAPTAAEPVEECIALGLYANGPCHVTISVCFVRRSSSKDL